MDLLQFFLRTAAFSARSLGVSEGGGHRSVLRRICKEYLISCTILAIKWTKTAFFTESLSK